MAFVLDLTRRTFGVSRNLTYQFKEFRASSGRNKSGNRVFGVKGNEKLLENNEKVSLPLQSDAPKWLEHQSEIMNSLKSLDKEIKLLEKAHREKNINAFKKESSEQQTQLTNKCETISNQILEINLKINKIPRTEDSEIKKKALDNVVRSLKMRLKDLTSKFKKFENMQNSKKPQILSDQVYNFCEDSEMDDGLVVLAPHINDGLSSLAKNMVELAEIFKDLSEFVVVQGTIFDRIDCAIEQTVNNTKGSVTHLKGAEKHQRCTRASYCILLLLLTILILIVVLGLKVYL